MRYIDKTFAPENGQSLRYKIGDNVYFVECEGVVTVNTVTGYYNPDVPDIWYAAGCRYLIDWDMYWIPVAEHKLSFTPPRGRTTKGKVGPKSDYLFAE